MKVGILTFHEGYNHGAFLQAFCMVRAVRDAGGDPVLINYKNRRLWYLENMVLQRIACDFSLNDSRV